MMAGKQTFYEHSDPRGRSFVESEQCLAEMEEREWQEGYNSDLPGCFHTVLVKYSNDNPLKVYVPQAQRGFGNLKERAKERQSLYFRKLDGVWPGHKLPLVLRRNIRLYDLAINKTLYEGESSLDQNYSFAAAKTIKEKWPLFSQDFLTASLPDALQMCLLPVMVDKARQQFLLNSATRKVSLKHLGERDFEANFVTHPTTEEQQLLASTVGETCQIKCNKKTHNFFVKNASENCLLLRSLDRRGYSRESVSQQASSPPDTSMCGLILQATFTISKFRYKVLETGIIDGWSGLANQWIDGQHLRFTGEPLIDYKQLLRLQNGLGFFNEMLSGPQRELVTMFLEHLPENSIQTLIAAPGTGKTAVLIEVAMQLNAHGLEESPDDALILYAVNTNINAQLTAEKFVAAGYPVDKILRVVGERAEDKKDLPRTVRVVRITDYVPEKHVNLIISPFGTASKIKLARKSNVSVFQKPTAFIFIDEVTKATMGEALTIITLNGVPIAVITAGDPCQLPPIVASRTSAELGGELTLLDAVPRNRTSMYKDPDQPYFTPLAPFGGTLEECFRASTYLTLAVSHLCYHGKLVASPLCQDHDRRSNEILQTFKKIPMLRRITSVLTWLNHSSPCHRNRITQSLVNPEEAHKVLELAYSMVPAVGYNNILIVTPYKGQANYLLTTMRENNRQHIRVASSDETQGLEASIVIVSLVRANEGDLLHAKTAGFLADPRRCNVLLSRAKHLVLLVGSSDHFLASGAQIWFHLLHDWATII